MLPLPTDGAPAAALASPAAAALCLRACTGLQYMSHLRILWKSLGRLSCRARYPSQIKPHYAGERGAHQQPSVQPCPHMYAPHPWALGLVAACSTLGCTCMPVTSGNQSQRYLRLPLHSPWTARADWPAMRCVGFSSARSPARQAGFAASNCPLCHLHTGFWPRHLNPLA